jgi:hypothetical protein
MKKIIFSLAIIRPNGEEEIVEVLDYVEIGSQEIEIKYENQLLPFGEEPPKP